MAFHKLVSGIFLLTCACLFSRPGLSGEFLAPDAPELAIYDKLVSCGVIAPPVYAQRLWTTRLLARHVERSALPTSVPPPCENSDVELLLERFKKLLSERSDALKPRTASFRPFDSASLAYSLLSGGDSRFLQDTIGGVDATINGFREDRSGDLLGIGHQLTLATEHQFWWRPVRLSAFARPRFDLLISPDASDIDNRRLTLEEAYLVSQPGPLIILAGRAPIVWGQGRYGGVLFSTNARPPDALQITTAEPFPLPWVFRYLGRWKTTYVFGTLGPEQFYPWSLFTGFTVTLKPARIFEISLSHLIEFGGEGSQDLTFGEGFQEFFGFIPAVNQTDRLGVNKFTGMDTRILLHRLMGLQFYGDYFMDDNNFTGGLRAWVKHFTYNSSWRFGAYFTRPFGSLSNSVRLETAVMAPIAYRHGEFPSGWALNGQLLGDPVGPDGFSLRGEWEHEWQSLQSSRLTLAWRRRDSNIYNLAPDNLSVASVTDRPAEHRLMAKISHALPLGSFRLGAELGAEWIHGRNFVSRDDEAGLFAGVILERRFGGALRQRHDVK